MGFGPGTGPVDWNHRHLNLPGRSDVGVEPAQPDEPAMTTLPVTTQAATVQGARSAPTSAEMYRALVAQRDILGEQLSDAQELRADLARQLNSDGQTGAGKASIEARIANVDARVTELDRQIAQSDATVATAAAVPGATERPPPPPRTGQPDEAYALGALFMFIVLLPMSIAFSRRIWRKSAGVEVRLPPEMASRMESLERGVEAIALEVERIGEGQRFVTQALAQRGDIRGVGAGGAEPVPVKRLEDRR